VFHENKKDADSDTLLEILLQTIESILQVNNLEQGKDILLRVRGEGLLSRVRGVTIESKGYNYKELPEETIEETNEETIFVSKETNKEVSATLLPISCKHRRHTKSLEDAVDKLSLKYISPPVTRRAAMHTDIQQQSIADNTVEIPPSVKPVFDFWLACGFKLPGPTTSGLKTLVNSILMFKRGAFFNGKPGMEEYYNMPRSTNADIIKAIKNFDLAAHNMDYEPSNVTEYKDKLAKTSMLTFMYNQYNPNGLKNGNSSMLLKYMKGPPPLLGRSERPLEDNNEIITKMLRQKYINEALAGIDPGLTVAQENDFIRAAEMCSKYYNKWKNRLVLDKGLFDFARISFDALKWFVDETMNENWMTITPGWLSTDNHFTMRVVKYMDLNALLKHNAYLRVL
jgi:hypothetical protein